MTKHHPLEYKGYKVITEEEALVLASVGIVVNFDYEPYDGLEYRVADRGGVASRIGKGYVFLIKEELE